MDILRIRKKKHVYLKRVNLTSKLNIYDIYFQIYS